VSRQNENKTNYFLTGKKIIEFSEHQKFRYRIHNSLLCYLFKTNWIESTIFHHIMFMSVHFIPLINLVLFYFSSSTLFIGPKVACYLHSSPLKFGINFPAFMHPKFPSYSIVLASLIRINIVFKNYINAEKNPAIVVKVTEYHYVLHLSHVFKLWECLNTTPLVYNCFWLYVTQLCVLLIDI
jgi:hypothetical protein